MEAVDEMAAPSSLNKDLSPIAKGKRTKRHRPHSPSPFTVINATISSSEDSTTTEAEDTARCLILLSRGYFSNHPINQNYDRLHQTTKHKKKIDTASKVPGGTCMYTCKTCNRAFHSFQALGGHRASHKKTKNEKKLAFGEDFPSPSSISTSRNKMSSTSLSLQLSNISTSTTTSYGVPKSSPSPKMHECSYCGAEFTSGQALGGHMRRHRNVGPPPVDESKNTRNVLSLDLNLPAPEDENQRFGFAGLMQPHNEAAVRLGLSTTNASTLVDCHF